MLSNKSARPTGLEWVDLESDTDEDGGGGKEGTPGASLEALDSFA